MKKSLAAKVLISAAAIFVMMFALGYNLSAQARGADFGRLVSSAFSSASDPV